MVGRNLCLEVALDIANISAARASWVACRSVDHALIEALLIKVATRDNLEGHDLGALFENSDGRRRHATRKDPSNVCMMSARRGEEDDLLGLGVKDWRDNSDIGEVPANQVSLMFESMSLEA